MQYRLAEVKAEMQARTSRDDPALWRKGPGSITSGLSSSLPNSFAPPPPPPPPHGQSKMTPRLADAKTNSASKMRRSRSHGDVDLQTLSTRGRQNAAAAKPVYVSQLLCIRAVLVL